MFVFVLLFFSVRRSLFLLKSSNNRPCLSYIINPWHWHSRFFLSFIRKERRRKNYCKFLLLRKARSIWTTRVCVFDGMNTFWFNFFDSRKSFTQYLILFTDYRLQPEIRFYTAIVVLINFIFLSFILMLSCRILSLFHVCLLIVAQA